MKKDKIFRILSWIMLAIIVVLTFVFYKYLPDKLIVQVNTLGQPSNYLSRAIFITVLPAASLLLNMYYSFIDKESKQSKNFAINLILLAGFILTLYWNIK